MYYKIGLSLVLLLGNPSFLMADFWADSQLFLEKGLSVLSNRLSHHSPMRIGLKLTLLGAVSYCYYKYHDRNPKLYANDFAQLGVQYKDSLDTNGLPEITTTSIFNTKKPTSHNVNAMVQCIESRSSHFLRNCKKVIDTKYQAKLYLKFINKNIGYGVFAEENIEQGHIIGEYTGVLRKQIEHEGKYTWDAGGGYEIDATKAGNFLRFVNHSDCPNVEVRNIIINGYPRIFYRAKTDIKRGQQLFVDYGQGYWTALHIHPEDLNNFGPAKKALISVIGLGFLAIL